MEFEVEQITGIPNEEVNEHVIRLMKNPRYVRHVVLPDSATTSTIVVVFRKART